MAEISGMLGLGDNIYQRAFIKRMGEIDLYTPWPQLYKDLPVRCLPMTTGLRTQRKNLQRVGLYSGTRPPQQIHYRGAPSIVAGIRACFGFDPAEMDLPDFGAPMFDVDYVVIRPVTRRTEWPTESRNPLPEYVAQAAQAAHEAGLTVVSVADCDGRTEWMEGEVYCDKAFHRGELDVERLLSLVQHARAVIGGVGWIVPAAMAAKVPAWIICGGQGGRNHPNKLAYGDISKITFAVPDNYCPCVETQHNCDKRITDHDERVRRWAANLVA